MKIEIIKDKYGVIEGYEVDNTYFYGIFPYMAMGGLRVYYEVNTQTREHYALIKRGFISRVEAQNYIKENYLKNGYL